MRKVFGGFFVFILSLQAHAASFHPYFGWRTIDTAHFSVHYHHDIEAVAQKAADYLEEAHEKLVPKYKWKPWGKTQVILTDNNDDSNGMASPLPYNWMLLRVAPPDPESPLSTYEDWLKTLATHEYTHILHLDAYGGFWTPFHWIFGKIVAPAGLTPGWVKEGTATFEETKETEGGRGRASYSEMLLRTAVLYDKFPTIDRADGVHWKWPGSQTQYIFGVKFLKYLGEKYGEEKLYDFHKRTQRSFFLGAVNKQAKKVYGKSYYRLWKEWQKHLLEEFKTWEFTAGKEPFTEPEPFLGGRDSYALPTFSRDGKKLAYVSLSPRRGPKFIVRDMETGLEKTISKKVPSQISFSPDGTSLVFSALTPHKRFYLYYDLFQIDLAGKKPKETQLTHGERARDPDWSPDGRKIIFVAGGGGTDQLKLYDIETKQITSFLSRVKPYTQFAQPRYSPDGSQIAVLRFAEGGWQICLADRDGQLLKKIPQEGLSIPSRPVWTADGASVIYSSDEGGVSNLYLYSVASGAKKQLTNVKTGLFQPAIGPNGDLFARYYTGEGFGVVKLAFDSGVIARHEVPKQSKKNQEEIATSPAAPRNDNIDSTIKKYFPFRSSLFLPRSFAPGYYVLDNGLLLSLATGSVDPLRYHSWLAGGTYRTDVKHPGYFGRYTYSRFKPVVGVSIDDFAVDYGTITFARTLNSYHLFEQRRRASTFFSMPLGKGHSAALSYFYEDRMPITNITPAEGEDLNLGIFAGIHFNYLYAQTVRYPASISFVEKGRIFRASASISDNRLGSRERNEQRIFTGDYREFVPLGANHVVALRMAGGAAYGDNIQPGTFSFGGSLGEGIFGGEYSSRYYSLRGLPVGTLIRDRVLLSSLEYRLPLISPQRGLGTWPFFLNNLHLAVFSDAGDAWNNTANSFGNFFDNFFVSAGLETRADFVVGHGLPVTGRVGYGVVVVNRDRLGNVRDPLLGTRVKNGIFILQFGTSF